MLVSAALIPLIEGQQDPWGHESEPGPQGDRKRPWSVALEWCGWSEPSDGISLHISSPSSQEKVGPQQGPSSVDPGGPQRKQTEL